MKYYNDETETGSAFRVGKKKEDGLASIVCARVGIKLYTRGIRRHSKLCITSSLIFYWPYC